MKVAISAALFVALATITSSPCAAQDIPGPGKACKADREKFCPGLKPGPELFACMKEHSAELSAECAAARESAKDARKAMQSACKDDAAKLCAGVEKGHGAIAKCLGEHASELSQACAEAMKSRPGAKRA